MRYLRVKFEVASSHSTPFQADTIFGHICWAIAVTEGEERLKEFLDSFQEKAPLLVSDGFPAIATESGIIHYLPSPSLLQQTNDMQKLEDEFLEASNNGAAEKRELYSAIKMLDKSAWLSESALQSLKPLTWLSLKTAFLSLKICPMSQSLKTEIGCTTTDWRKCAAFSGLKGNYGCKRPKKPTAIQATVAHNVVNRLTGTAEDPFIEKEYCPPGKIHVLASIDESIVTEEKLKEWFEHIALSGYGRDASTGKGSLKNISIEPFNWPEQEADSFLNLSSAYVPKAGELPVGTYSIHVKHGKLGGAFAVSYSPWKKPVLMIQAGSVFNASSEKQYGQLVRNIHYQLPNVVQYGYAFPLGVNCNG